MEIFLKEKEYKFYASIKGETAYISYVEVKKSLRKNGLGSKLVADFIKECSKNKVNQIKINAYKKCINFWKKIGFNIENKPQIINGAIQDYHDGVLILNQK